MFTTAADAKTYTLASDGRHGAKVTLTSKVTGARYTYQVTRARDKATDELQDRWFVALLAGPDNDSDYQYIGLLDAQGFRTTKGTKLPPDSKPVRGFNYFWKHLAQDALPGDLEAMHSGTCGRCGRTLTVPSSVRTGLGPECAAKMGLVCE
jgi:hypothetical protein